MPAPRQRVTVAPGATVFCGGQSAGFQPGEALALPADHAAALAAVNAVHLPEPKAPAPVTGTGAATL